MTRETGTVAAVSGAGTYLSQGALLLMALACGLCAGGNYFNQPLLHSIAEGLHVSDTQAALSVTVAQVSYACGLLFLVPLGDMFERKRLAVTLVLLAAFGQFMSGLATDITVLLSGVAIAGLFSVAAQVLVPMAASLSAPERSGRAVGLLMSGLLTGILLARSIAGLLSAVGGWQTVYLLAGVIMLIVAAALWLVLPDSRHPQNTDYGQILLSMRRLLPAYPLLVSRCLLGGLSFASVSVLFSTMALLLSGPDFGMSDAGIGLVGLAGVAGAMMASVAGRMADKGRGQLVTTFCSIVLFLSWGVLALAKSSLLLFLEGMLLIDLALQGIHISNQIVVYALNPAARSRLNAVYMSSYFIGAASGSAIGTWAWAHGGWVAACGAGVMLSVLNLLVWIYDRKLLRDHLVTS